MSITRKHAGVELDRAKRPDVGVAEVAAAEAEAVRGALARRASQQDEASARAVWEALMAWTRKRAEEIPATGRKRTWTRDELHERDVR